MDDTPEKQCPDCGRTVDNDGDAIIESCWYCVDKCDTCGGGDCDGSC